MHKDPRMTISPSKLFENVVVYLPNMNTNRTSGLKLVEISRASDINCFAVGNILQDMKIMYIKRLVQHQLLK